MSALLLALTHLAYTTCEREAAVIDIGFSCVNHNLISPDSALGLKKLKSNPSKVLFSLLLTHNPLVTSTSHPVAYLNSQKSPALKQARDVHARIGTSVAQAPTGRIPKLVVLDLDMCVWSPEMYLLDDMPDRPIIGDLNGRGEGVIGVHSANEVIRIFPGALAALQEVADGKYPDMLLAVASSADTPLAEKIGRAAMEMLEVLPGVTLKDLLTRGFPDASNLQIGRQKPLSSDKSRTHFPILRETTGIPYDQMLFFDDSEWSDHCGMVEANCPGVVTQRTPRGMQKHEWDNGLKKFMQSR